jgi:hypothetical protein
VTQPKARDHHGAGTMISRINRARWLAGPVILLIWVLWPGCDGFFIEPVLTGITVGPSTTIQMGNSIQMSAVGSYNDGSQQNLSNVLWSTSTPNVATISGSGLVIGVEPGQTTITGAKETVNGTATVSVTLAGLTAIRVTTQDGLTNIAFGESEQFIATGTANGEQVNITDSVTWSTSPSSISSVTIASTTGLLVTISGPTTPVQFQVIATDPTSGISGTMAFTVHP